MVQINGKACPPVALPATRPSALVSGQTLEPQNISNTIEAPSEPANTADQNFAPSHPGNVAVNKTRLFHEKSYMLKMRSALEEMDREHEFVPDGRFLDLGCCPGGFAAYILNKWPSATGLGISLPPQDGGHSLAVSANLQSRLEIRYEDLTMFDLAPSSVGELWDTSSFPPCPVKPSDHSFDLVMADGHIHDLLAVDNCRAGWCRDRLVVSQLLITLRAVKPTGTLLLKLSLHASPEFMKRIVVALRQLTEMPVKAIKPMCIYANKPTFYLLVNSPNSDKCDILARKLEGLWCFMTFFGYDGVGRRMSVNEFNIIAIPREITAARGFLDGLFAPIDAIYQTAKAAAAQPPQSPSATVVHSGCNTANRI